MNEKFGFIVGSNLPGCLPEGVPDFYPDAESAQFGFVDIVVDAAESSDMDMVDLAFTKRWVHSIDEELLGQLPLGDEYNVQIGGRHYWITKHLDVSDILSSANLGVAA